jgi:uncharacterized membrane protein YoaT (DUF817 family)
LVEFKVFRLDKMYNEGRVFKKLLRISRDIFSKMLAYKNVWILSPIIFRSKLRHHFEKDIRTFLTPFSKVFYMDLIHHRERESFFHIPKKFSDRISAPFFKFIYENEKKYENQFQRQKFSHALIEPQCTLSTLVLFSKN